MTANQASMIGLNHVETRLVPPRCTANKVTRIATVIMIT